MAKVVSESRPEHDSDIIKSKIYKETGTTYHEACANYKYYRERTKLSNAKDLDFSRNFELREHYHKIKMRYDLAQRSKRSRKRNKDK